MDPTSASPSSPASAWLALAKPGITGLIVLLAVAGFFAARPPTVAWLPLLEIALTGGAASAGSAMLNHVWDRDLDRRMRRTLHRPLVSEAGIPPAAVTAVGLFLIGGGIAAAALVLNLWAALAIFLGAFTYVVVYTMWLKRRTRWNIVIGGFAGSAPVLGGSAAAVGHWTVGAVVLALLVFLWTPPHFWSLALALREDYARADLPMLPDPRDAGASAQTVVASAALLVPATIALGFVRAVSGLALGLLVALAAGFLATTLPLLRDPTRRAALRGFVYSGPYLVGVAAILVGNYFLLARGYLPVGW